MASRSAACAAVDTWAQRFAGELSVYPKITNFDKALDETKPDVVSVNTYPDSHAYFCRKAFNAGCHVFTEKPLATTVDDA